jgi:transcriptional regulator with XRE-family HTH domain
MSQLAANIRALRQRDDLTQAELAMNVGVKRSVIGAYEEGRAEPRLQTLIALARFFNVGLDALVLEDLSGDFSPKKFTSGGSPRVLPIAVDREDDTELITVVPVKAAAGYLNGFGDVDFIASLPRFRMPVREVPQDQTLRMFQVEGDSMHPLPEGSYVVGTYVEDLSTAGGAEAHVVVTRNEGVVFKRVENLLASNGTYRLVSDNPAYPPYEVPADEVEEMWKARAYVLFSLPSDSGVQLTVEKIEDIRSSLQRIEGFVRKGES